MWAIPNMDFEVGMGNEPAEREKEKRRKEVEKC